MKKALRRAGAFVLKHRKRVATLTLVVFLLVVGGEIMGALPRETSVEIPLGDAHAQVTEARVEYWADGAPVQTMTRRYASGAPAAIQHELDLSPGTYTVRVLLLHEGGLRERLRGRFEAPADGVVQLSLSRGSS